MKKQLAKVNADLDQLFADLEKYSTEKLCKKPTPDAWSAIQVMHHLRLSEKYSLAYCEKKLSFKPKLKKAGILAAGRAVIVDLYLSSPFKFKAPAAISGDATPNSGDLATIKKEWKRERDRLEKFINDLPAEYADKEVYKHPFGGRMSIKGMLQFFESHFRNHRKQIFRALEQA